jgi:hypothetical protein
VKVISDGHAICCQYVELSYALGLLYCCLLGEIVVVTSAYLGELNKQTPATGIELATPERDAC